MFLTEQFLIKKRVLKGTGGGGNLRVNQADYYETWQMCTSHGPTKTLMETVHIRFSSLPIPWKSQSLGNFLPDDIFPQALSRKCQYRSQLCHVISRQPSRVERQNSPFTKQDSQGGGVIGGARNSGNTGNWCYISIKCFPGNQEFVILLPGTPGIDVFTLLDFTAIDIPLNTSALYWMVWLAKVEEKWRSSVVPVKREINLGLRTCIVGTMSKGAYRGYQIRVSR